LTGTLHAFLRILQDLIERAGSASGIEKNVP
jgi:hypothetical protein